MNRHALLTCIALTALLSGCSANRAQVIPSGSEPNTKVSLPFLSRRIFAKDPNDTIINLQSLRKSMQDYVAKIKDPIGVDFEYLPSGSAIGIHRSMPFIAASLLKLPVAIKAYQLRAEGALKFDDVMTIQQDDIDQGFGTLWQKGVGAKITVRDLILEMLEKSDNTALRIMTRKLNAVRPAFLNEVFDDLDLPKEFENDAIVVSAENYTSILRTLYLASNLPKADAQEILSIMTQSIFKDKIPAGVADGVPVAHKVGMYEGPDGITYSDCGIVYIPKRPYSLCILTKADNETATKYISDLSKMAYDFISKAEASGGNF